VLDPAIRAGNESDCFARVAKRRTSAGVDQARIGGAASLVKVFFFSISAGRTASR